MREGRKRLKRRGPGIFGSGSGSLVTISLLFCTVLGAGRHEVFADATIEGRVMLKEKPTAIRLKKRYQAGPSNRVGSPPPRRAVVYLEGNFPVVAISPPSASPELAQRNLQFSESILPVAVGTAVVFPNEDSTYHNVFSYSPTKRFDLGRYAKGEGAPAITFDKPGVVKVFCEVHNHMRSTILVLETPFFTVTDDEGSFRLAGLPTGDFTLKVWLSEREVRSRAVSLINDAVLKVDIQEDDN